jgi:RES domain-containing protein
MTAPLEERDFAAIVRKLRRLITQACAFKSTAFRSVNPRYATEADLLSGHGSREFGGRWNTLGLAAVYASLSPETAMAETLAHVRYYGLPAQAIMPRTFVAISFALERVLDLTDGKIRRRLRFSLTRHIHTDWRAEMAVGNVPLTQVLGRAAADVGYEGLLVPSVAEPGGQNIVAFPKNITSPTGMVVLPPQHVE